MMKINSMNEFIAAIPTLVKAIKNRNMSKQIEKAEDICNAMMEYSKKYSPTTGNLPIAKKDGTTGCVSIGPGIDVTATGSLSVNTAYVDSVVSPYTDEINEGVINNNEAIAILNDAIIELTRVNTEQNAKIIQLQKEIDILKYSKK